MAEITYEDFSCEVDVAYRIKHNKFPLLDEKMSQPSSSSDRGRSQADAEFDDYLAKEENDYTAYQQNLELYPKIMRKF